MNKLLNFHEFLHLTFPVYRPYLDNGTWLDLYYESKSTDSFWVYINKWYRRYVLQFEFNELIKRYERHGLNL
jgi:hypothetical protein